MVRQWQSAFYGKRYSQTDPHRHTDFVKLAEGFGLKGYRCQNLAEFQSAFAEAMKRKGPTWIECIIDKDENCLLYTSHRWSVHRAAGLPPARA